MDKIDLAILESMQLDDTLSAPSLLRKLPIKYVFQKPLAGAEFKNYSPIKS